jgi:hypothetical protein
MICGTRGQLGYEGCVERDRRVHLHPAKIPLRPLLEKLALKFVLYGVLSLLNLI